MTAVFVDPAEQVLNLLHRKGNGAVLALGAVASGATVTCADPADTSDNSEPTAITSFQFGAGNVAALVLPAPQVGTEVVVLAKQDSSGSRTIGAYNIAGSGGGSVVWVGHSAPTLTTTA